MRRGLAIGLALAVLCTTGRNLAQDAGDNRPGPNVIVQPSHPSDADGSMNGSGLLRVGTDAEPWLKGCADGLGDGCARRNAGCAAPGQGGGLFGGADFLLLRTHFSQDYAFATVSQSLALPIVRNVNAVLLPFDYDPSFRVFIGYQLPDNVGDFRFTYWYFRTDASKGERVGSRAGFNESVVDPLGSMAQTGDLITAHASVLMNIFDLDFEMPLLAGNSHWALTGSVGVRIADINQKYNDPITTAAGGAVSAGFFTADFVGAGPRLGLEARRYFGETGRFSLFAKGNGSLLVGTYDFTAGATLPFFGGNQSTHVERTIPVAEIELGASWCPWQFLSVSAGWLFQAWFDLGASGGQFGGIYVPVDTANIMSFDGLVLRAELRF